MQECVIYESVFIKSALIFNIINIISIIISIISMPTPWILSSLFKCHEFPDICYGDVI